MPRKDAESSAGAPRTLACVRAVVTKQPHFRHSEEQSCKAGAGIFVLPRAGIGLGRIPDSLHAYMFSVVKGGQQQFLHTGSRQDQGRQCVRQRVQNSSDWQTVGAQ